MPNVVGDRFQITIDKKVRDRLGIRPGDRAVEWVEDGRLIVAFLPREHDASMLGVLKHYVTEPIEPITDWQALKDDAWDARAGEIAEALQLDGERHRDDLREAPR